MTEHKPSYQDLKKAQQTLDEIFSEKKKKKVKYEKVLWVSQVNGTYVKGKHGELK